MTSVSPTASSRGGAGLLTRFVDRGWVRLLRRASRLWHARIGFAITAFILLIAFAGPLVAPYSPTEFIGAPFASPSGDALLGTDSLGRDVLSRFLYGGRTVVTVAVLATMLGVALGTTIGVVAAYSRGKIDNVLMRTVDVALAFPNIIFVLLLVAAAGPNLWTVILAVGISHAPGTARVIRGAAQDIVERDFVKASELFGRPRRQIVFREILPNVSSPLLVEFGVRLTWSIGIVAAISFLGFGLRPPAADWGLMVNENRLGITEQPWAVVVPALAVGALTIGTNLINDGVARVAFGGDRSGTR